MKLTNGDLEISITIEDIYREIKFIVDDTVESLRSVLADGTSTVEILSIVETSVEYSLLRTLLDLATDRSHRGA